MRHAPGRSEDHHARASASPKATGPRLALSGLVHKALVTFNERGQHRRVLINVLILAQALLLVAAAPGYVGASPSAWALAIVLAGLFVCVLAAGLNQLAQDSTRAAYVLVIGGALTVIAQVYLAALTGTPAQAAQASLLSLTVILDAGLFFAPEVTLIIAGGAIILTIAALMLAIAIKDPGSRRETYGLVVGTLGLQTVVGLMAWLLSLFIYDSVVEAQQAQDLQFAQARLDALMAQQSEHHARLQSARAAIHQAVARALDGGKDVRVTSADADLSSIAADINLLLEQLSLLAEDYPARQRADGGGIPLIDLVGRPGEGATPAPASLPVVTGLPVDAQMGPAPASQASIARRLLRTQELAGEAVGALAHSQEGLSATAETAAEALRTAGASVATADDVLRSSQRAIGLIGRMYRALVADSDERVVADPQQDPSGASPAGGEVAHAAPLLGLGTDLGVGAPGLTGEFLALGKQVPTDQEVTTRGIGDAEAAASDSAATAAASGAASGEKDQAPQGSAPSEPRPPTSADAPKDAAARAEALDVNELERVLEMLRDEIAHQERGASALTQELGIVSRHVRGIDVGVAWARQAIEAVRRNAERLYQTSGGPVPPLGGAPPISRPLTADMPGRTPPATRPLADVGRLPSGALFASPASAADVGQSALGDDAAPSWDHPDGDQSAPPPDESERLGSP
jgi:hypothetical protein